MPPEARQADVEGAEAFIRYYIDTVNYAYDTGDLTAMRAISELDCSACRRVEGIIEEGYQSGSHIEGADVRVREVTVTPGEPELGLDAVAIIEQDAGRVIAPDGRVLEDLPEGEETLIEFFLSHDPAWAIAQWAASKGGL